MHREQIIKALECCLESEYCATCPATGFCGDMDTLMENAFYLIKQLTEENERLSGKVAMYEEERKYHFELSRTRIAEAKADTVRKMQERLKANKVCRDGLSFKVVDFDTIDQIANEMVEGEK